MSQPIREKNALVVSAHSADFVWRAGGAIALHVEQGYQVHIVCLSFGERGESAKLWRKGNMTEETVKHHRREEAQAAADTGVQLIVIRRPAETGETADQILTRCREVLKG